MISFLSLTICLNLAAQSSPPSVSPSKRDAEGFLVHEVRSPLQAGPTQIRVLLPDRLEPGKRYRVIYLLPVEAGREQRYGDGLAEAKRRDLHNRLGVIFVAPTFAHLPWYADHPTRADLRQETYFLEVVVPFIDATYPVIAEPRGRLLLGFSKSGWGALSLLLRHPERFGKAAAWDAPLMMTRPDRYGMGEIFGTQENFEKYRISELVRQKAGQLRGEPRIIHLGYGSFRDHHRQAEALLAELRISREYRDGPQRAHDWHSGWVSEAVDLLLPN